MSKVYLVGAGPGDPELLTLKALRLLRTADVVLYDRLISPAVLSLANPRAELIYVGKRQGEQEDAQNRIFRLLLDRARQDQIVVRLKGGDACVFGRAAEEWLLLARSGIEVEIVPGISSALAAPALAGVPLTCRGVSRGFAVVSGHCTGSETVDWSSYAHVDTLVVLMGVQERVSITRALIRAGRCSNEPALFVERSSTPAERVIDTTLGRVAAGEVEVESPAVFVMGAVVALRTGLGGWKPAVSDEFTKFSLAL
jgi:uroporphyrin-III C-methyltransferase